MPCIEVARRTRIENENLSGENHGLRLLKGNEIDTGSAGLCKRRLGMILNPWNRNGPDNLSQSAEKKGKKDDSA